MTALFPDPPAVLSGGLADHQFALTPDGFADSETAGYADHPYAAILTGFANTELFEMPRVFAEHR